MHKGKVSIPLLQDYDEVVDHIDTEIKLASAESTENAFLDKEYIGLWDSGSTKSCIKNGIEKELGLKPAGKNLISTANGEVSVNTYYISIELPNGEVIPDLVVSSANITGDIDVLIGMDVIMRGDFRIDNSGGRTNFSFVV